MVSAIRDPVMKCCRILPPISAGCPLHGTVRWYAGPLSIAMPWTKINLGTPTAKQGEKVPSIRSEAS